MLRRVVFKKTLLFLILSSTSCKFVQLLGFHGGLAVHLSCTDMSLFPLLSLSNIHPLSSACKVVHCPIMSHKLSTEDLEHWKYS
jgi:hypothetical protein